MPAVPICELASPYAAPDGSRFLTLCRAAMELRDASSGEVLAQRPAPYWLGRAAFSQDGSLVAIASRTGIEVRGGRDLSLRFVLVTGERGSPVRFALSPHGERLACLDNQQRLVEVALVDGQALSQTEKLDFDSLDVTYVGDVLVARGRDGQPRAFRDGERVTPRWVEAALGNPAQSWDGSRLAFRRERKLVIWDVATDREIANKDGWAGGYGNPTFFGPYVGVEGSQMLVLSPADQLDRSLGVRSSPGTTFATPDGRFHSVEDGDLLEWTPNNLNPPKLSPLGRERVGRHVMADELLLESSAGRHVLRGGYEGPELASLFLDDARAIEASPRGELLAVAADAQAGKQLLVVSGGGSAQRSVAVFTRYYPRLIVDQGAPRAALNEYQDVWVYDTQPLVLTASFYVPFSPDALSFRSPQNEFVSFVGDGRFAFHSLKDGSLVREASFGGRAWLFQVANDGRHIAARSEDDEAVLVWSERGLARYPQPASIDQLRFSTDSRALRVLSKARVTTLDPETGREIGRHDFEPPASRFPLELMPSGKLIGHAGASADPAIVLLPGAPRARAFRNTPELPHVKTLEFRDDALLAELDERPGRLVWPWSQRAAESPRQHEKPVSDASQAWPSVSPASEAETALAERGATSADGSTRAVVSDHGRRVTLVRGSHPMSFSLPAGVHAVQRVALSRNGARVALISEDGRLVVASEGGASRVYALRANLGVFALAFDPSDRFVVVGGNPLRFVRLRDGETLNQYVGYLDHGSTFETPLLFVGERGEHDGDRRLLRRVFCPQTVEPDAVRDPCVFGSSASNLVPLFFRDL